MKNSFDAVVIGAGPGGYVCAIRLAQLGIQTAIVEKGNWGGVCLNVGCIPSKALIFAANQYWRTKNELPDMGISAKSVTCNLEKLQQWKSGVVQKLTSGVSGLLKMNGVSQFNGQAIFRDRQNLEIQSKGEKYSLTAKNFVIATGSRSVEIPSFPFNGKNIISSTEALELKTLPKQFVLIGGGFIGLEIGVAYAKLGSQVTIVEALEEILTGVDRELVQVAEKRMKKLGIEILTSAKAIGVKEKQPEKSQMLHLEVEVGGKEKELAADKILVSVGRRPNSDSLGLEKLGVQLDSKGNILTDRTGKTNVEGIFAIGDVNGAPQLAHRASMDGLLVAASIKGEKAFRDYRTVPWAVFCDPEIAVCGLTEKEAKEKGIPVRVGRFPFAASGRALSTHETDGLIKVIVNESDDSIVGVHIVGPEASNLIAEAALAIEMGACVEDVVRTIHTHPTLPEAFPEAIEAAFGRAIHIYKPLSSQRPSSLSANA